MATEYKGMLQWGDTAANLAAVVPANRQMVFSTDTHEIKFGDGVTAWASLPSYGGSGGTSNEIRHETAGGYDYTGVAPLDSSESASVWTITRITLTASPPTVGVATGAEWVNRATETYV